MLDETVQALICTCNWILGFVGKFNFLLRIYNEPFSLYNYFILILILFIDDDDDSSDIEDVDLSNVEPNVIIRDNANVDED